jgi:(3R)-3-hydroxyacyl-CoA dehydrogenase / 3a,7a,12a-trihydroxy-5b-cholest-24-enoyl-CoA hydratase / enoyl-CoA hydratase 2
MGFPAPILHGLATFAVAARALINSPLLHGDAKRLKSFKVRFASPVTPGDTLLVQAWSSPEGAVFQVTNKATGKVALSSGVAEFVGGGVAAPPLAPVAAGPALKSAPIIAAIKEGVAANPALADKIKASILLVISGHNVLLDFKSKPAQVVEGAAEKADCTLTIDDDNFVSLASGKLNPQTVRGGRVQTVLVLLYRFTPLES